MNKVLMNLFFVWLTLIMLIMDNFAVSMPKKTGSGVLIDIKYKLSTQSLIKPDIEEHRVSLETDYSLLFVKNSDWSKLKLTDNFKKSIIIRMVYVRI